MGQQPTPRGVGCCPIETLDFFEFSRHLWQFPSKNQAFWPAGLLACWPAGLLACCSLLPAMAQTTTNIEKCWGPWHPPSHPPWGGLLPHRNLRFFLNFLGTFGNSLLKIRPFGLLACWPVGLLACWPAAHCCLPWPKQPPTLKNVGALGPPSHPLGVGCCPIETLDFFEFSRHLWQFPSKNQAFGPAGLLACWPAASCCSLLLTAACHSPNNHQHSKMLGGL